MTAGTVYVMPVTFGFGPASHAVSIAKALRSGPRTIRLVAVADGIAARFLGKAGVFDEVVEQDGPGRIPTELGRDRPAVAVSVADFDRARAARARKLPVVVVDALYWMWDRDPMSPDEVDRYLCLAFPGVEARLARLREKGPGVRVIPQILDGTAAAENGAHRKGALLNFGGAVAPFGSNGRLLASLVEVVAEATGDSDDLLVSCSAQAAESLVHADPPPAARVEELTLDGMMRALATRRFLFTLPGLSIMWEALRAAIPTVVLPAANYSQHMQVAWYARFFEGTPILTWDDLDGYGSLPAGLPEVEGGSQALALGERFAADAPARRSLARRVREALSSELAGPSLRDGHPWSSFDGADQVAGDVVSLLAAAGGG